MCYLPLTFLFLEGHQLGLVRTYPNDLFKIYYLFEDLFSNYSDILRYLELGLQDTDLGSAGQPMTLSELSYK